jgi:hypothetical protein
MDKKWAQKMDTKDEYKGWTRKIDTKDGHVELNTEKLTQIYN